jgi:hypothetical protein
VGERVAYLGLTGRVGNPVGSGARAGRVLMAKVVIVHAVADLDRWKMGKQGRTAATRWRSPPR